MTFHNFGVKVDKGGGGRRDDNPFISFTEFNKVKREAEKAAIGIVSSSPEGVVNGGWISLITIKRNPIKGTIFAVGCILAPIIFINITFGFVRGVLFPAPIAENAPNSQRMGNAAGRGVNYFWNASKPGVAALEVQWRQEEKGKYGGGIPTNSPTPQSTSTQIPGLTLTSNSSAQTNQMSSTGLSQAEQQAISNFLK